MLDTKTVASRELTICSIDGMFTDTFAHEQYTPILVRDILSLQTSLGLASLLKLFLQWPSSCDRTHYWINGLKTQGANKRLRQTPIGVVFKLVRDTVL